MIEPGLQVVVHNIPSIPEQRNIVKHHELIAVAVCRDDIPLLRKQQTPINSTLGNYCNYRITTATNPNRTHREVAKMTKSQKSK